MRDRYVGARGTSLTAYRGGLYAGALIIAILVIALHEQVPAPLMPTPQRLTPAQIGSRIGRGYGDPHARVLWSRADQSEGPPFHLMYFIRLSGHFHKGILRADTFAFSATTDHLYVWGLAASRGKTVVWRDDDWPTSWTKAEQTPLRTRD